MILQQPLQIDDVLMGMVSQRTLHKSLTEDLCSQQGDEERSGALRGCSAPLKAFRSVPAAS